MTPFTKQVEVRRFLMRRPDSPYQRIPVEGRTLWLRVAGFNLVPLKREVLQIGLYESDLGKEPDHDWLESGFSPDLRLPTAGGT